MSHIESVNVNYNLLIEYLEGCNDYLPNPVAFTRLKDNIQWFSELRQQMLEHLTDEQIKVLSSKVKNRLQAEANQAHKLANRWGLICMATGTGKTKTAIDAVKTLINYRPDARILIVVPTVKLRDKTWKDEFKVWGAEGIWELNVDKLCYASLSERIGCYYDLVIMDEVHNLTEKSSDFFLYNEVKACMALTATPPESQFKQMLLDKYRLQVIYEITLDEAVDLGVVAPYEITIIQTELDKVRTNVKAGSKLKQFYVTEANNYAYFAKIEGSERPEDQVKVNKFFYIRRMRFIYELNSKLEIAQKLLKEYIPSNRRVIIFCGSTDHADKLSEDVYHSKRKKGDLGYENFVTKKSRSLSCVEALNEGDNLPDVDIAFIEQLNSNRLDLIQRIGRVLRFRAGHIGRIIILCVKGTVDEKWTKLALLGLDTSKIRWVEYNDLVEGKESLTF